MSNFFGGLFLLLIGIPLVVLVIATVLYLAGDNSWFFIIFGIMATILLFGGKRQ